MKINKFLMVSIFLLVILTLGAVSASNENATFDELTVSEDFEIESSADAETPLADDSGNGTFEDIRVKIDNASSYSTVELDRDYVGDGKAIEVYKSLTIDGNNHVLDAKNSSNIFRIGSEEFTLRNIVFANGHAYDGGAIISCGDGPAYGQTIIFAINCTFINCTADMRGGASMWVNTVNCTFINCHAPYYGAGYYNWEEFDYGVGNVNPVVIDCSSTYTVSPIYTVENPYIVMDSSKYDSQRTFRTIQKLIDDAEENDVISLSGYYLGVNMAQIEINKPITIRGNGATLDAQRFSRIFNVVSDNVTIMNLTFVNALSEGHGSAVCGACDISDCTFMNCAVQEDWVYNKGGAIYGANSVLNCSFIDCSADVGGAVYGAGSVVNCTFLRCSAESAGAVYGSCVNCNFTSCHSYDYAAVGGGTAVNCIADNCTSADGTVYYMQVNSVSTKYILQKYDYEHSFEYIQKLIDDALEGSTLVIPEGYYYGFSSALIVNKRLTIDGQDRVRLDGQGLVRIFEVVAENVKFMNLHMIHGYSDQNGGAIHSSYGCTVNDCTFNECYSKANGGAVYGGSGQWCTFWGCTAEINGGATYGGNFKHATFDFCHANGNGGACYGTTTDASNFYDCSADGNGGAVYLNGGSTNNGIFYECYSKGYGAAIYGGSSAHSEFRSCISEYGPVTYNCDCSDAYFDLCSDSGANLQKIINNANDWEVIRISRTMYMLQGTEITINKPLTIVGYGLCIDAHGKSRIFNINANNVRLENIEFANSYGDTRGGAILFTGSDLTLIDCTFTNSSTNAYGGAIGFTGSNLAVIGCTFENSCSVTSGGAIHMVNTNSCTFINSSFIKCYTTSNGGSGGAISGATYVPGCSIVNCEFVDCYSDYIAVISNCNITSIRDATFRDCRGFYILDTNDLANSTFIGCRATESFVYGCNSKIENCSFINSKANNAIFANENDITTFDDGVSVTVMERTNTLTVINSSFINSSRLIYTYNATCNIYDSYFESSLDLDYNKGQIYGELANMTFENCRFVNFDTIKFKDCNLSIVDCNFTRPKLKYLNPAIVLDEGNGSVVNARFEDFQGVAIEGDGKCSVINSIFINRLTDNPVLTEVSADNCVFVNCTYYDPFEDLIHNRYHYYVLRYSNARDCIFINCPQIPEDNTDAVSRVATWSTLTDCVITEMYLTKEEFEKSSFNVQRQIYLAGDGGVVQLSGSYDFYTTVVVDRNVTIIGNDCRFNGFNSTRAMLILRDNVVIRNITFANFASLDSHDGGAISCEPDFYAELTTPSIFDCTFINCSAFYTGWLRTDGGAACGGTFYNSTFISCRADYSGGAISRGSAYNCTFIGCSADDYGGAISESSAYNSTFIECYALKSGGAILTGSVYNSTFIGCYALSSGGAILQGSAYNSTFIECHAVKSGGAISQGSAYNSTFINCTAGTNGGAMYGDNAYDCIAVNCTSPSGPFYGVETVNCIITDYPLKTVSYEESFAYIQDLIDNASSGDTINVSGYFWGVRQIEISKPITINGNDLTLDGQTAVRILHITSQNVNLNNIKFVNGHTYQERGGAVYSESGYVNIENCSFINCEATKSTGGAVFIDGSSSNIRNSIFVNCRAHQSGGAFVRYSNNQLVSCIFENCSADIGGGQSCGYAISCDFINCHANEKGGAKQYGTARYCNFINCTSGGYGGATIEVTSCYDCNFSECYAGAKGAAMNDGDAQRCIFINCTSGSGYALNEGTCTDCTFINCSAGMNSGLYVNIPSQIAAGTDVTFEIDIESDYGGNITAFVDDVEYPVVYDEYDGYVVTVNNIASGSHTIKVCNSETVIYRAKEVTRTFRVALKPDLVVDTKSNIYVGQNALVSVSINENITGAFTIQLDGENYPFEFINGNCLLNISGLDVGRHTIYLYYAGDETFFSQSKNVYIYVNRYNPNIRIIADPAYEGQDSKVTVSMDERATGSVVVKVDGAEYPAGFKDGAAEFTLRNLTKGAHQISVQYEGDDLFESKSVSLDLTVTSNPYEVSLSDLIEETENWGVLTLARDYVLNSSIYITKRITIDGNGHALDANGSTNIFEVNNYVTFKNIIFRNANSMEGSAIYGRGYTVECINCTFINCIAEDWGGAINSEFGTVRDCTFINCTAYRGGAIWWIYSNRGDVYNSTFINCYASGYGGAIRSGNSVHDSTFIHCGVGSSEVVSTSHIYDSKFINSTVVRSKVVGSEREVVNCTFTSSVVPYLDVFVGDDVYEGSSKEISVSINSIITDGVSLLVGNASYPVSIYNGWGKLTLENLTKGTYVVVAVFEGDESYAPRSVSNTFRVLKNGSDGKVEPEVIVPALDDVTGDNVVVSLPDDAEGSVTLTVNGSDYVFNVVNGKADIALPDLANGNYPYTITYSGDGKYSSFNASGSMVINRTPVVPEITVPSLDNPSADGSVAVSLPADAKGTVTLTVGGIDYVFDVVNGKANVILPDLANGNYPYTITYSGDGKYSAFATNGSMTVNKIIKTSITASSKLTVIYGCQYYVATLNDAGGKAIPNVKVTVKFSNGKAVTATTDKSGRVRIAVTALIPLKTYKATMTFAGNTKYAKSTKTISVVVKKATPALTAANKAFKASAKTKQYTVILKDNLKKPIKSVWVSLTVNKKTYKVKTNTKGQAIFKITNLMKKGNFRATVKFAGNSYYNAKAVKPLIVVK